MILGYVSGVLPDNDKPQLCIVADRPSDYSVPIRVESLISTDCAIHLVSNFEGLLIESGELPQSVIISAVRPAKLYLSPNLPEKPGFSVDRVLIAASTSGSFNVRFDRGRNWEDWRPNIRVY